MVCDSIRLGKKAIGFPLCKPSLRMLAQPVLFPVAKSATLFEGNKTDVPEPPSSPINVASIAAEALAIAAKAAAADLDAGSGSSELLLQFTGYRCSRSWHQHWSLLPLVGSSCLPGSHSRYTETSAGDCSSGSIIGRYTLGCLDEERNRTEVDSSHGDGECGS